MSVRAVLDWIAGQISNMRGPGPLPPEAEADLLERRAASDAGRRAIERSHRVVDTWNARVEESWRPIHRGS